MSGFFVLAFRNLRPSSMQLKRLVDVRCIQKKGTITLLNSTGKLNCSDGMPG